MRKQKDSFLEVKTD